MTEEEKRRTREAKQSAVAGLKKSLTAFLRSSKRKEVDAADPRIVEYIRVVAKSPKLHNYYEVLAVARFLRLVHQYVWRGDKARRFFRFYEQIKFSGVQGRTRYKLTPVQCFQFANIYGLFTADGRRLTQTAYIFVPRKFSKTTSAASMAVYDLLFGDSNAQAYVGANSYNQAKICFDEIRAIMRQVDPSGRHIRINREKIFFENGERDSSISCLAANAKTQDGLFASLVIMDEYSQARNTAGKNGADLKNVLTTSMGPRRNPLCVIITTASEVLDGPFAHELDGVKRILRGEAENDTIFASLFMPDVDDREDDPKTWAKVQPHLGVTVQPDFYEREWRNAQISAENMLAFRTKLLNVFAINEEKTWFTPAQAKRICVGGFNIDRVTNAPPAAVALDLSVRDDFSAVSYTYYDARVKKFYCHTDYYFPRGAMAAHPNRELYKLWAAEGYLKLCDGEVIDYKQIGDDIIRHTKTLTYAAIGYDRYKAQDLVNYLTFNGAGHVLQPFSQMYGNFNLPVETFEFMAGENPSRIILNDNPINVWCLTNAIIDEDRMENKKPVKPSRYRKIDGVITMLMTIGLLSNI